MSTSQNKTCLGTFTHDAQKNLITAIYRTETREPQLTQIGTVSSACHQAKLPV